MTNYETEIYGCSFMRYSSGTIIVAKFFRKGSVNVSNVIAHVSR